MFANPLFLFALLGAGVPVLIHLIHRRKRTALAVPTLRFLRRAEMKLASRRKLREWLLLALRVAAVACVALALARPGFRDVGAAGPLAAATDAVLALDNSASMGLPSGTGTRLDRARARAAEVLGSLGAEGRAALLSAVPAPEEADLPALSGDRAAWFETLKGLQPQDGAGSLTGLLARAGALLAESSSAPNREIHLFSDLQTSTVADEAALREALGKLPPRTRVFVWAVTAREPERNAALADVTLDPRPKVVGRSLSVRVKVRNPSARAVTTTLSAGWTERPPQSVPLALEAGETREVDLRLPLEREGFAAGEAALETDDALFDNRWPFAVHVRGPLRVLVVSSGESERPEREPSFYLRRALDPTGDGRLSGVRVEPVAARAFPLSGLDAFEAVALCGWDGLSPQALSVLDAYVRQGHGVLVFAGTKPDQDPSLRALWGARIVGECRPAKEAEPFTLVPRNPASPFFDDCRDRNGGVEFKEVRVAQALRVIPDPETEVLAALSSGDPALLLRRAGLGRVLSWTLGAQAEDSNLPLKPVFLSLLHRGVALLAGGEAGVPRVTAGTPLILDLYAPKAGLLPRALTLFGPHGLKTEVPLDGARLAWRRTGRAGTYRLEGPQELAASARNPRGFCVTPDPAESEPRCLRPEEVSARCGGRVQVCGEDAGVAPILTAARTGRDLFGAFMLAALAAILAEALLANLTVSRAAAPRRKPPQSASAAAHPPVAAARPPPGKEERAAAEVGAGAEETRP